MKIMKMQIKTMYIKHTMQIKTMYINYVNMHNFIFIQDYVKVVVLCTFFLKIKCRMSLLIILIYV